MKVYGLLGGRLGHSFSPQIHSVFGDYEYRLFPRAKHEIDEFFSKREFAGINVTIPYKQTVIPYCDVISPIAQRLHSINTITVQPDGTLHGDNTDYRGFLYMLGRAGISVKGKNTLVLGSGGSSHTVCAALEDEGAKKITVFKRSDIENYANLIIDKEIQIIINCTPVGMYPDNGKSPVNLSDFPKCEAVADLIYNPDKTELLLQAKKLGLNYVNGLTMLVAQAKYSSELFTGTQLDEGMIEKALKSVRNEMRNIVLIGMPGSGKTSVGKRLSELMKRRFFDSDEIITRVYEKNPAEIIEKKGESFFRLIEATVISEAGKATSAVISTGGGAVINEQNIDYLRQNGIIIFLERDLGLLDVTCRPLSSGKNALQALYNARIPLYRKYADYIVDGNGSIEETAKKITEILK